MKDSLIEQNRKSVSIFTAVNLVLGYTVLIGLPDDKSALQVVEVLLMSATFMSIMGIVVVVIGGIVSPNIKARIVSIGLEPLPGYRAFTKRMLNDDRINVDALRKKIKAFPVNGKDQNLRWYRIYKKHAEKPSVSQAHKSYLLTMEMSVICLLALSIVVIFAFVDWYYLEQKINRRPHFYLYLGLLVVQFIASAWAARTYGISMVRNVLAEESAK